MAWTHATEYGIRYEWMALSTVELRVRPQGEGWEWSSELSMPGSRPSRKRGTAATRTEAEAAAAADALERFHRVIPAGEKAKLERMAKPPAQRLRSALRRDR